MCADGNKPFVFCVRQMIEISYPDFGGVDYVFFVASMTV